MPLKLGNTNIAKAYLGSHQLSQMFLGDVPLLYAGPRATRYRGRRISPAVAPAI